MTTAKIHLHWALRTVFLVVGLALPALALFGFTRDPNAGTEVFANISFAVGAAISLAFACAYHQVEVTPDALTLRYFPVYRKTITYSEISSYSFSDQPVSPMRYGGTGLQLSQGGLTLTNRKGYVLRLELITGHKYTIAFKDHAESAQIQNLLQEKTKHVSQLP